MKNLLSFIAFLVLWPISGQEISLQLTDDVPLEADTFIGADHLNAIYYIKGNTLYKYDGQNTYSFNAFQLGQISSVSILNPLKMVVFYRDFNTITFLDNRLNELITPISFSNESIFKNINLVSLTSNDNLWLYSPDDTTLNLWNHRNKKVTFESQPIKTYFKDIEVTDLQSSYKKVYVIGKDTVLLFNEFGTFMNHIGLEGLETVRCYADHIYGIKENSLYFKTFDSELQPLQTDRPISIKSYDVTKDHLYIFDGATIFVYDIIKK